MGGVIRLLGQPLELLGELEQFRFDIGTDHKTDERPNLASLLAIIGRPRFYFRHHRRTFDKPTLATAEQVIRAML